MTERFPATPRNALTRRIDRGSQDKASVFAILDASLVAHIGYELDGQPYVTPTLFWRDGETLYWHGSRHGRTIRNLAAGRRVCVTVSHLDGLVLGRSGIASSIEYRSVMAFGTTRAIDDRAAKKTQMARLIDRQFPGRAETLRPTHDSEIDQIMVIEMPIDEATAKIKVGGPNEREPTDFDISVWAGIIPVRQILGRAEPDPRLVSGIAKAANVERLADGVALGDALTEAARR
jgi:uncharacterized protein